jgi:flavoprotein
MQTQRLAWAISGSGHYIEECVEFMLTLNNVDLYLSQAGEEVLKMYGISLASLKDKMPVYRDKAASAPPVGLFYKG